MCSGCIVARPNPGYFKTRSLARDRERGIRAAGYPVADQRPRQFRLDLALQETFPRPRPEYRNRSNYLDRTISLASDSTMRVRKP